LRLPSCLFRHPWPQSVLRSRRQSRSSLPFPFAAPASSQEAIPGTALASPSSKAPKSGVEGKRPSTPLRCAQGERLPRHGTNQAPRRHLHSEAALDAAETELRVRKEALLLFSGHYSHFTSSE
jgi:hypothetical protein